MAIIYPSGLYSEGQGVFDAMPYVRFIEAKRKAKDEAFKKYYDNLKTQINTAGVRTIDRNDPVTGKGIELDIDNWTAYGIQHRDEINKGGAAKLEFEKMQRNILNRIEQSKGAGKFDMEIGKAKFDGKYDPTDDDMQVQARVGYSIYDPRHYKEHYLRQAAGAPEYTENVGTEFNWGDLSPAVSTLDEKEKKALYDFGIGKSERVINPKIKPTISGGQYVFTKEFSNKDLLEGAQRVANEVMDKPVDKRSRRIKKTYDLAKDDPEFLAQATPIYKQYFNKDITTAADAAAADFLLYAGKPQTETRAVPRPRTGGARGGGSGTSGANQDIYYISDEVGYSQGKLATMSTGRYSGKQMYVVPVRDVDPERLKIITGAGIKGVKRVKPISGFSLTIDGKREVLDVYLMDPETGDWIGANDQTISREAAKDRYINSIAPTLVKQEAGTRGEEDKGTQPTKPKIKVKGRLIP